jgi:hypothetical protein
VPVEIELGVLALMLGVEMRWLVLAIEHPNDDPKKTAMTGMPPSIPSSLCSAA